MPIKSWIAPLCDLRPRRLRHALPGVGFREADVPHSLEGFGHLVAGGEGGSVLGVYWSNSVFPGHRSPPGTVLLQVILGGTRDPGAAGSTEG